MAPSDLTWIGGNGRVARRVGQPMARFLAIESASGLLLIVATIVALVWANSPWAQSYDDLLHVHLGIEIGSFHLDESLLHWINDGLMAIFFFVVGLEIKRELVAGELRDPRAAMLPTVAAAGGMIVPAIIYVAFTRGGDGAAGWGIPMATDIAFALGIASLLGRRVPASLKIFLLTLAIVDDIGAIAVIAIFYSSGISFGWLGIAFALLVTAFVMQRARIWYTPVYVGLGGLVWFAMFESGVHATIAGVALGLLTPARPLQREIEPESVFATVVSVAPGRLDATTYRRADLYIRECVPVAERLETLLHPVTSFVIIPIFALANAGIVLSGDGIAAAATSPVTLGVIVGLVIGKTLGVWAAAWLAVRAGWCRLPAGVTWPQIGAVSTLAGIGFTVSLFITGLAFTDDAIVTEAKMGILFASALAAIVGGVMLHRATSAPSGEHDGDEDGGGVLESIAERLEPIAESATSSPSASQVTN